MIENSIYYRGYYKEKSFSSNTISLILLELLKNGVTYPMNYDLSNHKEMKVYDGNNLSNEWYEYIKNFDIVNKSCMLKNKKKQVFAVGRNRWGNDHMNFYFTNVDVFPNNQIIINENLNISFLINSEYNFLQSTDNPQTYDSYKIKYDKSKLYFNENIQMELLDISKNVGRVRHLEKFDFYPAYKIWFGKEAQYLFGKEKILNFTEAIYVKELPNGIIEMQLMDDIMKPHLLYNQEKQRKIIEYLEVDKLEIKRY